MVTINKKRIQIVASALLIGLFAFSFQIANNNRTEENNNANQESTIQTTATPVSGKKVVIDAGHGIPDERSRK
jgi:N-acetylmuramoyl-L-alanine amidase